MWSKDLGNLDSGWFYDSEFQWGFGSSPIIHDDRVIVQCDAQKNSFIVALDIATGSEVWRTSRDEIPTWSSPTVCETPDGPVLVTNGTRYVRGYDAETGSMLWQVGGNSEIAVPTPFVARGLIFTISGYRSPKPIRAIRLDARGDLTAGDGSADEPAGDHPGIAWSNERGGSYLPTPIAYREYLYVCNNDGVVTCYHAISGERVRRIRLRGPGRSFTASPIAGDGHLYFTSESGDVYVVQAGPKMQQLHVNSLGEYCLSTPAVSDGVMFFRGQKHLIAVQQAESDSKERESSESESGEVGSSASP